jgi:hypothetical protein
MHGLDRERLISALILMAMALFVGSGTLPGGRWRRPLRLAAIIAFLAAFAASLAEIGLWWAGRR